MCRCNWHKTGKNREAGASGRLLAAGSEAQWFPFPSLTSSPAGDSLFQFLWSAVLTFFCAIRIIYVILCDVPESLWWAICKWRQRTTKSDGGTCCRKDLLINHNSSVCFSFATETGENCKNSLETDGKCPQGNWTKVRRTQSSIWK